VRLGWSSVRAAGCSLLTFRSISDVITGVYVLTYCVVVKEIKYWLESYFFLVSCIYDFIHNIVLFF